MTSVRQALKLLVGNQALKDLAVASLLNFGLATTSTKKLSAHVPQLASELQHPLLTGKYELPSFGQFLLRSVSLLDLPI